MRTLPLSGVLSGPRVFCRVVRFVMLQLQDYDIKRAWPGCVIAEPYVSVRSLPYTRGQVCVRCLAPLEGGIGG